MHIAQHPPVTPGLATCMTLQGHKLMRSVGDMDSVEVNVLTFVSIMGAHIGAVLLTPLTSGATNLLNKHQHVFIF